ncbi:hypothetical protein GCM10020256_40680 [Streptomyces thermocoprophilus]
MPGPKRRGGLRVADQERGEDQMEFVGQFLLEELGVDRASALDHEPAYASCVVQVFQEVRPVQVRAQGGPLSRAG